MFVIVRAMSDSAATPRSRRERPAKPALTRDGIVATAIGIMRAEGLPKVTMRRLAQELDTGPASLYVYVSNTAELHAAILDELLGTVGDGAVATGAETVGVSSSEASWRERLEAVLTSYTLMLFEHPSLARSALVARPSGPHYLDLIETLLALLDEGGVPRGQAAWGVNVLLQIATTTAAEHSTGEQPPDAQEEWDSFTRSPAFSPPTRPHLGAVGAQLLSGTPEQRLSWGFRVLIDGILRTPLPPAL
jgi:AcrR family transcriptional regulator